MANRDHGGKQDPIDKHSLPGTNQAGKRPEPCDENDHENKPDEHSLPGTNQAGKGPDRPDRG